MARNEQKTKVLEENLLELEMGESLMLRRVLLEHFKKEVEPSLRRNLFRTICKLGDKCCKVIVDIKRDGIVAWFEKA